MFLIWELFKLDMEENRKFFGGAAAVGLAMLLILILTSSMVDKKEKVDDIGFKEFVGLVENKKIENARIIDEETITANRTNDDGSKSKVRTITDTRSEAYKEVFIKNGLILDYEKRERPSVFWGILLSWAPLFLILGMSWRLMRRGQQFGGAGRGPMSFEPKDVSEQNTKVKFDDVVGVDEAKSELVEIVDFLKRPHKFKEIGGKLPKGALLVGPPGTGKTMLARATANQAGVPFYSISGSSFVELFVGVGASRVRGLFERARKNSPCIIFIDEIDAIGKSRAASGFPQNDEREQTLNQLLVEMDGIEQTKGIIVMAATNRAEILDQALLRPGRFDRRIHVSLPDSIGREKILRSYCAHVKIDKLINLSSVARSTHGFSGADLANLVNESAINAVRMGRSAIIQSDMDSARDKITMGYERKSAAISDSDKRVTAIHEIGHALVNIMIPGLDPLYKVSIIPRGNTLGVTQTVPESDPIGLTREKAEAMISMLLGGRAAEMAITGGYSTGASNDLERASRLARAMVCEWGMGSNPFASYPGISGQNENIGPAVTYSQSTLNSIDKEVEGILSRAYSSSMDLINKNKELVIRLANLLVEKETISLEDIEAEIRNKVNC